MPDSDRSRWRPNWRRAAVELVVVFAVVTSAFFEPDYNEFRGIHGNYLRHLDFVEREVLPRIEAGPDAYYDASGRFDPAVRVRMALIEEFTADLDRLRRLGGELTGELEAMLYA